ncbi:tetratricopeptide repeat protein [Aliarcobacter butzleri]|uniref:tetratricopeptide repeat protein n=1 Tax=Aliarcobacter butzleri TaxID=28197 RepID=UPI0021B3FC77|nr:tetratricopeptide repeat protein [Aliarcobacter butzleri]MCT7615806.1 tetratricopeptide repeat protein [Aliarcobacter butzleri]
MLKQIFPLLFTLIFSTNLFAQVQDINKELTDIKLQLQEIKLLDARDEREKKIEKLEKDIKELEEKFNQNNIDKKDIEKSFDKNKEIIDRQDKRIEDIGTNLNYWGIGFSLIAIFTGIAVFLVNKNYAESAKKEALISVYKWIEENKDKILEPIINEGNNLLKNIRKEADLLLQDYQSTMKKHNLKDELDSKEKDILEKVNILLESKETENYTFNDWHSKFLDYFYKDKFYDALKAIDNAIKIATNEIEISFSLYNKGLTLGKMDGKEEKAIKIYDELIERFKDSKENNILEQVAKAFVNKGFILGKMNGKAEEAIKVYNELIERFKDSKENNILEQVAKALYNKGVTLGQIDGKAEETIKVYDELIEKFKDSKENNILEQVAKAFLNKGFVLAQINGKAEEAIKVYDELIERFKDSKENNILEQVASALLNKIETNIISGNTNSKEDLDLFLNLVKENKEKLLKFEMLKILEKAKDTNQDEKIKNWQIEFKDTKLKDWSFDELKTWAETLEGEAKERVLRYIDIFEKHKSLE